jgi:NAD(P)H-hydrate epimerase
MRSYDAFAVQKLKVPGIVLMENAGRGVVDAILESYGEIAGRSVLIICGKGNNGGDGFVIARHLFNKGGIVTVGLTANEKELKGDARANYLILKAISSRRTKARGLILMRASTNADLNKLPDTDYIIDALFGTGFSGEVKGFHKKLIGWMNASKAIRVSVDIPSGMNADAGSAKGIAVKADLTVTMGYSKVGFVLPGAKSYLGKLKIVSLGTPTILPDSIGAKVFEISGTDVARILPKRKIDAHKYSFKKVFVLAGSRGYIGAAAMTAEGVLRAGGAMVMLGTPVSVYPILAKKLSEVMVTPLPETSTGSVSLSAWKDLERHLEWADIVVLGPGLSREPETIQVIQRIVSESRKYLLVDADGLNALSEKISILKKNKNPNIILTPHSGELSRLINVNAKQIDANRLEIAQDTAKKFNVTLVLKGVPTITANAEGFAYVNSTGNPGMATGGSGDVLSGIIAGLWSQGMETCEAAYAGVYLHGLSGDLGRDVLGEKSLLAGDLLKYLPQAFVSLESRRI